MWLTVVGLRWFFHKCHAIPPLFPLGLMSSPHITVFFHDGMANTSPVKTCQFLLGGIKCQIFSIYIYKVIPDSSRGSQKIFRLSRQEERAGQPVKPPQGQPATLSQGLGYGCCGLHWWNLMDRWTPDPKGQFKIIPSPKHNDHQWPAFGLPSFTMEKTGLWQARRAHLNFRSF